MTIINHARLKEMAKELGRPLYTLEVLANDPFTAGVPARKAGAKWFAELWERLDIQPGVHLRRIHYQLLSQPTPVLMLNGEPYQNTEKCEGVIERTSLDARYLGLVPGLVDRRNAEPMIYLPEEEESAALIGTNDGGLLGDSSPITVPTIYLPSLTLSRPVIPQRYHVEIWCEKSTMNDVLDPLGERYGVNIITGTGEQSETQCVALVERALSSGLPVRVLYLSDFDPGGQSMPVATARKTEFELYRRALQEGGLDVQVRPIVLTLDQCQRYRLPRTPIKDTETRAAAFEARFGEGVTELDALEALRPGELAAILEREIARYYDDTLDERVREVEQEVESEIVEIVETVRERHADKIAKLEAERVKLAAEFERMAETKTRLEAAFEKKVRPVLRQIKKDIEAAAPSVDDYDWPEPDEGDEDPDPLFDSTRDYVEQIDRYKEHQGKPTQAPPRKQPQPFEMTCARCGTSFMATRKDTKPFCSRRCRDAVTRAARSDQ